MIAGTDISARTRASAEVTNISPYGFWILSNDHEYFIDYKQFPFFENSSIKEIVNVQTDLSGDFHWPDLDVDIELDSFENPEKYPLIYQ